MKERPILFSALMVRAILAGTKTQTRRIVKNEFGACAACFAEGVPHNQGDGGAGIFGSDPYLRVPACEHSDRGGGRTRCPFGFVGDRLWVRETHAQFAVGEGMASPVPQCVAYRATCTDDGFDYVNGRGEVMGLKVTKWTPAIHMPRWASRITLEVTGVRVERLQAITEANALAEGMPDTRGAWEGVPGERGGPRETFRTLWDHLNEKRAPWGSDPWVWVVEFKRVDARAEAA